MKLFLRQNQSPGDLLMMTAMVRDLKSAYPQYEINVRTSAQELWYYNPCLTYTVNEANADRIIDCHYPLINTSNEKPYHFINGFRKDLEEQLGITIPQGPNCCDVYLSPAEKQMFASMPRNTAIVDAGYKNDFTCKMWVFDRYQEVIDRTKDKWHWVQIGARHHNHAPLQGVENLVGATTHRQLLALMYQASLVLTPVSYPYHLSTMQWRYGKHRPCVVIAGGREPSAWINGYNAQQVIHNCCCYDCNVNGGCWRSRVVPLGDGDAKDKCLCVHPVNAENGQTVPQCMYDISVDDVVRRIEMYRSVIE